MANARYLLLKHAPPYSVGRFPVNSLKAFTPSLGVWAAGAGTAALFLLSVTPKVKRTLLSKVPVVGTYFEDHQPASDKPF
ncbi:ubiquinol-cytochrome-c reductase complex subunit-domain-containing protein [Vararia minispora EC-137]|uniref:Ubiquinol-cytochrome-c reductase complex subunit-domain-containing protein n=1 Tax=Vararia minispora EC-137 TaxID=1314806 RepID=A0ACB8QWM6_9AGAM|nr:ubiquinol-cytochrome-c reductase complex subunit-domain-containing protein [Vararia minispora EC-137]